MLSLSKHLQVIKQILRRVRDNRTPMRLKKPKKDINSACFQIIICRSVHCCLKKYIINSAETTAIFSYLCIPYKKQQNVFVAPKIHS